MVAEILKLLASGMVFSAGTVLAADVSNNVVLPALPAEIQNQPQRWSWVYIITPLLVAVVIFWALNRFFK